jgi:hypothetical protein
LMIGQVMRACKGSASASLDTADALVFPAAGGAATSGAGRSAGAHAPRRRPPHPASVSRPARCQAWPGRRGAGEDARGQDQGGDGLGREQPSILRAHAARQHAMQLDRTRKVWGQMIRTVKPPAGCRSRSTSSCCRVSRWIMILDGFLFMVPVPRRILVSPMRHCTGEPSRGSRTCVYSWRRAMIGSTRAARLAGR